LRVVAVLTSVEAARVVTEQVPAHLGAIHQPNQFYLWQNRQIIQLKLAQAVHLLEVRPMVVIHYSVRSLHSVAGVAP
jgi:hypothetical protein